MGESKGTLAEALIRRRLFAAVPCKIACGRSDESNFTFREKFEFLTK